MEPTRYSLTCIVRLTRGDGGVLDGVVERVRTGETGRLHSAALADVIAAMAARETVAGGES